MAGVTAIVHCAGTAHGRAGDRRSVLAVNFEATEQLALAAARQGVRRFVFLSSAGAGLVEKRGLQSATPYQESKYLAEKSLLDIGRQTSLEVIILRSPLVYGRGAPGNPARLEKALRAGWPLPLASIKNHRSVLARQNLAQAIDFVLDHPDAPGEILALSDGPALSTPAFAAMMAQAIGKPARLYPFPPALFKLCLKMVGKGRSHAGLLDSLVLDERKIRGALGWRPPLSTTEALQRAYSGGPLDGIKPSRPDPDRQ